MPLTASLSDSSAENQFGFGVWMERVLERAQIAGENLDRDAVHDLRVALRRCRTMAEVLDRIEPESGWNKVKKLSRELFQSLGELHDAQIERSWVKRLAPEGGTVRKHMLRVLARRKRKRRAEAARALDRFDAKSWRKLARKLMLDAPQFPPESTVLGRVALGRLNDAVERYRLARKGHSGAAWHRMRIDMKRFRYVIENFLPPRYEAWSRELKYVQDSLGEIHDLDVLRSALRRGLDGMDDGERAALIAKIEKERMARLEEFRARIAEPHSPWHAWRAELPFGTTPKNGPALKSMAASAG